MAWLKLSSSSTLACHLVPAGCPPKTLFVGMVIIYDVNRNRPICYYTEISLFCIQYCGNQHHRIDTIHFRGCETFPLTGLFRIFAIAECSNFQIWQFIPDHNVDIITKSSTLYVQQEQRLPNMEVFSYFLLCCKDSAKPCTKESAESIIASLNKRKYADIRIE